MGLHVCNPLRDPYHSQPPATLSQVARFHDRRRAGRRTGQRSTNCAKLFAGPCLTYVCAAVFQATAGVPEPRGLSAWLGVVMACFSSGELGGWAVITPRLNCRSPRLGHGPWILESTDQRTPTSEIPFLDSLIYYDTSLFKIPRSSTSTRYRLGLKSMQRGIR